MKKLVELFNNEKIRSLLHEWNEKHLIAGGSVVYTRFEDVPKESVGDVDIFISSAEDFTNITRQILPFTSKAYTTMLSGYDDEVERRNSVLSFILEGEDVEIQLIHQKYESPMDVLNTFDLDYVQCGYVGMSFVQTQECRDAHRRRKIMKCIPSTKIYRLLKAAKKGFTTTVFGSDQTVPGTFKEDVHDFEYFLKNLLPIKKEACSLENVPQGGSLVSLKEQGGVTYCSIDKHKFVGLEIEVLYRQGKYYTLSPISLDDIEISQGISMLDIPRGKHVALVQLFVLHKRQQCKIWIDRIISGVSSFDLSLVKISREVRMQAGFKRSLDDESDLIKANAYKRYKWGRENGEAEEEAVREATRQFHIDRAKERNYDSMVLFLNLFGPMPTTEREMIDAINQM